MMTAKLLILMVGALALCAASPARMFFNSARRNSPSLETVATVDCSNREAVKFVAKTNANFRCVYPESNSRPALASDAANNPILFGSSVGGCSPGQVYDPQLRVCTSSQHAFPAGLQSASLVRKDPTECEPGKMFVPEIGMCLEAYKPRHTAPLESDSLVVEEPKDEISSFGSSSHLPSDCKSGEIYNSELSLCMTANKKNSEELLPALNLVKESEAIAPLELFSFSSSINTAADCKLGEMYVSEINTCVEINPSPPLQSASLIRARSADSDSSRFDKPVTPKDCTRNEVYVSEIGICLPVNPPKNKRPIVSDSLVKDEEPSRPVPDTPKSCDDDEIYVSEIGICLQANKPKNRPTLPSSASLVKEPEKLEIQAFETSKNFDECPRGTHFVPEIGLCLN